MSTTVDTAVTERTRFTFIGTEFVRGSKILLVDDQTIITDMLSAMFAPLGFFTRVVNDSLQVVSQVEEFEPDLILLDVSMPGKSGFELSKELKSSARTGHIPIILVTALDDKHTIVEGFSYGVQDYVTKPFHKNELIARAVNHLTLKKQQDFWRMNQKLMDDQFDDQGLPRKTTFCKYLESSIASKGVPLALAIFSIYDYGELIPSMKMVNAENLLSLAVFERLHSTAMHNVFVGNLGSGKFGVIFFCEYGLIEYSMLEMKNSLERLITIGEARVKLNIKVGYCKMCAGGEDWPELVEKAEIALLDANKPENPPIREYSPEKHDAFNEKWWILNHLEEALSNDEMTVYYQPQFDLRTLKCTGYEALARWHSKTRGSIRPDKFIAIAEKYNLISSVGGRILRQTLSECRALNASKVAVNISPMQLKHPDFPQALSDALAHEGVAINQIELEITESTVMDNKLVAVIEELMQLGFDIAIDDFGTGYSNLSILTRLPFAKVKIDRSLISDIHENDKTLALVSAVVKFSEKMGFTVLAEGVEIAEQADILRYIGVGQVQGYLYGRPAPVRQK